MVRTFFEMAQERTSSIELSKYSPGKQNYRLHCLTASRGFRALVKLEEAVHVLLAHDEWPPRNRNLNGANVLIALVRIGTNKVEPEASSDQRQ